MFTATLVGHRYGAKKVLEGIDLAADPGELIGLQGQNGSGKSTLLRILCGHIQPTSGKVDWGPYTRGSLQFRMAVTLVAQRPELDPEMTGRETLQLFRALYRTRAEPLSMLDDEALDKRVGRYSGGMKRRLHLMVGSLAQPTLLGLDEPAAGLDKEGAAQLWEWVRRRCKQSGVTVVVASHRLPECDRVVELP